MYKISFTKRAKKFIDALPKTERVRIVTAIEKLPGLGDIKKLQGYQDIYRLIVGSYRILYTVDDDKLIIVIIDAGNRGEIYNRY